MSFNKTVFRDMTSSDASMFTADSLDMDAASKVTRALTLPICTLNSPNWVLRWDKNCRDILAILLSPYR